MLSFYREGAKAKTLGKSLRWARQTCSAFPAKLREEIRANGTSFKSRLNTAKRLFSFRKTAFWFFFDYLLEIFGKECYNFHVARRFYTM